MRWLAAQLSKEKMRVFFFDSSNYMVIRGQVQSSEERRMPVNGAEKWVSSSPAVTDTNK